MLKDAIISAANHIGNNKSAVDALNVFPVPDGDTGSNMSLTMKAAARELAFADDSSAVGRIAAIAASSLLRGARGNSGVILSLIFSGFSKGLEGCGEANGHIIAAALSLGVEKAYKSVMNPTEGTILTVVRVASEKAAEKAHTGASAAEVWREIVSGAEEALKKTPEMLPVLKKAKVVDAGGKGLALIFEAMRGVFEGNAIIESAEDDEIIASDVVRGIASGDEIRFAYCTEAIINKKPGSFLDALLLRSYLESVGDCVVVVEDEDIIKIHAHSNEPGNVITRALSYGSITNVKIDNMVWQHRNIDWGVGDTENIKDEPLPEDEKPFGFVAVAAGDGLIELFAGLGADRIVSGGQTMNPSTEELLNAVNNTPAGHVFILPNNKNIIMAAEQAVPLAARKATVIRTESIPQGIAALLNFDPGLDADGNIKNMNEAMPKVSTVQVTFAARDSVVNGQNVKKGQVLVLENGKITAAGDSVMNAAVMNAAYKAVRRLASRHTSVVTIIYGEKTLEKEALELEEMLKSKLGGAEIVTVNGGQPIYFYIISIE